MVQSEQILQHIVDLIKRHAGKPELFEFLPKLIDGYAKAKELENVK